MAEHKEAGAQRERWREAGDAQNRGGMGKRSGDEKGREGSAEARLTCGPHFLDPLAERLLTGGTLASVRWQPISLRLYITTALVEPRASLYRLRTAEAQLDLTSPEKRSSSRGGAREIASSRPQVPRRRR